MNHADYETQSTMKTVRNRIDISVIVPVYNVEAYLPACLDSLKHQGDVCLEIMLVNDGSTDQSGVIADRYAKQHNRIKVIHQENKGASAARNAGLKLAQGEYIVFVDSDDRVKEYSLCKLYHEACKYQADVVMGRLPSQQSNQFIDGIYSPVPNEFLYIPLCGKKQFINLVKTNAYTPVVWNWLYRRKFMETIQARFEEGIIYEDELWSPVTLCQASTTVVVDIDFYHYRQREGSVMQSTNLKKRSDSLFRVSNRLIAFAGSFEFSGEDGELKSWLYVLIFRLYARAFALLACIKDTSYVLPDHHLDCFRRDYREMMPEPQKICYNYFRSAEISLNKYMDWRTSEWVESVDSQLKTGKRLMLVYNILPGDALTLNRQDVPADWVITTDRRYFKQACVAVFHLPGLYQVFENDLEKQKGQIWVSWYLESETGNAWIENPELSDTFDFWLCYRQDNEQKEHPLVHVCRKVEENQFEEKRKISLNI